MNSFEKLIYETKPVQIYSLAEDSLVCKELASYAVKLQETEEYLDSLICEIFLLTAKGKGFQRLKKLYGVEKFSDEEAKEIIEIVINSEYGWWNYELFQKHLDKISSEINVIPGFSEQHVRVVNFLDLDIDRQAQIVKLCRLMLPCFLCYRFLNQAYSWDDIEEFSKTFTQIDYLGLNFDEIEYI